MLTAAEQFFLEQLNRARLNPYGEAERFGIGLNDPDPTNSSTAAPSVTLSATVLQPLAENAALSHASGVHSEAFLAGLVDLTGPNAGHNWIVGTTPQDRAREAKFGFALEDTIFVGENGSLSGTTAEYSAEQAVLSGVEGIGHHQGLFYSIAHRPNMLNPDYSVAGVAQRMGDYSPPDNPDLVLNASVMTNKLGVEDFDDRFLTGVAYDDLDGDQFYSIGEGVGGVTIAALGQTTSSAVAGGYALNLGAQANSFTVEINWQQTTLRATIDVSVIDMSLSNVKLDIVGGTRLMASGDLTLLDGVAEGGLLGAGNLSLTGNSLDNLLLVGRGDNTINGGGGTNTAWFTGAFADYIIKPTTSGTITVNDQRMTDNGGAQRLSALGDGNNTLTDIQILRFADGEYSVAGTRIGDVSQGQITIETPAIGAYMSVFEQTRDLVVSGTTKSVLDGTKVFVTLDDKTYETATSSGKWTVTIRAGRPTDDGYVKGDLDDLVADTDYIVTATAQTAAGAVQTGFQFRTKFDIPALGTFTPSPFADPLTEADLTDGVTLSGTTSAQNGTVTILLAGVAHQGNINASTSGNGGEWSVTFPGSTLRLLEDGESYTLRLRLVDEFDNAYGYTLAPFTAQIETSGTGSDPVTNPDPDPVTNPDPDPGTNPDPDPVVNPDPDPGTNPDPVTDPDPVTNPDPQPNPDSATIQVNMAMRDLAGKPVSMENAKMTLLENGSQFSPVSTDATGAVRFNLPEGSSGAVEVTRGWQTGDPQITALDALEVLRMAVGLTPSFGQPKTQNFIAADINADGLVTALDALEVLRAAVGLQSASPPRWVFFDDE